MPSIFARKKSSPSVPHPLDKHGDSIDAPRRPSVDPVQAQTARSPLSSPDKKSRSSIVKEQQREREKQPKSPRRNRTFGARRRSSDSHPLNLPPEELRRLSALQNSANMGSPKDEAGEPMQESTPAPQTPGAFPNTNGNAVNGDHSDDAAPPPPPHRSPSNSPPPAVDAEKCKEAGNKFFKAQQYDKAIEEYTKGGLSSRIVACHSVTL